MLDCHCEYIGISFQIPAVVITHYIYQLGGGTNGALLVNGTSLLVESEASPAFPPITLR
jgi:hypothetical protein